MFDKALFLIYATAKHILHKIHDLILTGIDKEIINRNGS